MTQGAEKEIDRWNELLEIAGEVEPELVPILQQARAGGLRVMRYSTGRKAGALYVSISPGVGAEDSLRRQLNCGPGLHMYMKVQAHSQTKGQGLRDGQRMPPAG